MTALVGPLQAVYFHDGQILRADLPRNTLDLRWLACGSHRFACDCREAEFAEDQAEWRAEAEYQRRLFRRVQEVAAEVLKGHATWARTPAGLRDEFAECKCSGCDLARRADLRDRWDIAREHRETLAATEWAVPF